MTTTLKSYAFMVKGIDGEDTKWQATGQVECPWQEAITLIAENTRRMLLEREDISGPFSVTELHVVQTDQFEEESDVYPARH